MDLFSCSKERCFYDFPRILKQISTQFGCIVKSICSDNAPELQFKDLLKQLRILHFHSCAYTPQQNSVVERKHQHLLNVARSLYFQPNIPLSYWPECVSTTAFHINRTPTPVLNNRTPFEVLYKKIPDFSFLRVFGCLCYASIHSHDRHKFIVRARPCAFLGYEIGFKGYKVLDLEYNTISITKNIVFHENLFPFLNTDVPNTCPFFDDFFYLLLKLNNITTRFFYDDFNITCTEVCPVTEPFILDPPSTIPSQPSPSSLSSPSVESIAQENDMKDIPRPRRETRS